MEARDPDAPVAAGAPPSAGPDAEDARPETGDAPPAAPDDSQEAQPTAAPADEPAPMPVPPRRRMGSVVRGTVVGVTADQLLVDIGDKSDGIVPLAEVAVPEGRTLADLFTVGQTIPVALVGFDAQEGTPRLSHRRAAEAEAWEQLAAAMREGRPIDAPVVESVKGGLVLRPGVRAFMPASHVERAHVADLAPYVGQVLRCRVLELDRGRGKVILSRKSVLEEEARQNKERLWGSLEEGQVCEGVVKSLTDFGAFVDIGGVDGLLHVSAMAWNRVRHPAEVVSVGDRLTVKILKLDREHQKISLGLKQLLPDPWTTVLERYPVGAHVEGTVARLAAFGAFVELEPGIDGLVHVSQMADRHVREPREVVQVGERVRAKVIRVVPEERRISLSIREADPNPGAAVPAGEREAGAATSGGATLGEVIGDLGDLLERARRAGGAEVPGADRDGSTGG